MLSRLLIANAIKSKSLAFPTVRVISTSAPVQKFGEYHVYKDRDLKDVPADYKEFPERDLEKFPRFVVPVYPPKVRFGFIPESWFDLFYNKTGVTGPYALMFTFGSFLIGKEYYVLNDASRLVLPFILVMWGVHQLAKKPLAKFNEEQLREYGEGLAREWKETYYNKLISQAGEITDHYKNTQAAGPMYFQAFRENYYMTMEAEYRRRLNEYKTALKRKLDYFVDLEEAKRAYQRRHMVEWVVQHVSESITDQVQKAALTQCVNNLKLLSQKHKV